MGDELVVAGHPVEDGSLVTSRRAFESVWAVQGWVECRVDARPVERVLAQEPWSGLPQLVDPVLAEVWAPQGRVTARMLTSLSSVEREGGGVELRRARAELPRQLRQLGELVPTYGLALVARAAPGARYDTLRRLGRYLAASCGEDGPAVRAALGRLIELLRVVVEVVGLLEVARTLRDVLPAARSLAAACAHSGVVGASRGHPRPLTQQRFTAQPRLARGPNLPTDGAAPHTRVARSARARLRSGSG